mmetsp:Transcript_6265/g.8536  ORF Transcript_6265/g.8536 Transcript_6265/m.8536 type:complete len:97 (-) Transcript_6265:49-339(-)
MLQEKQGRTYMFSSVLDSRLCFHLLWNLAMSLSVILQLAGMIRSHVEGSVPIFLWVPISKGNDRITYVVLDGNCIASVTVVASADTIPCQCLSSCL